MQTARADRLRNDERILRVAARLLARDPAVSMQAIAETAGVARLTVYRRYPDRDALVTALRATVDVELDDALSGLPPWDGEGRTVHALVHALARVAARYPVALLRYAPVPADPPAADARVTALLREGQRAGLLRDDLAAETLHAALFGILSAVLSGEPALGADDVGLSAAESIGVAAAADTVLTLLLPGISRPPPTRGRR